MGVDQCYRNRQEYGRIKVVQFDLGMLPDLKVLDSKKASAFKKLTADFKRRVCKAQQDNRFLKRHTNRVHDLGHFLNDTRRCENHVHVVRVTKGKRWKNESNHSPSGSDRHNSTASREQRAQVTEGEVEWRTIRRSEAPLCDLKQTPAGWWQIQNAPERNRADAPT